MKESRAARRCETPPRDWRFPKAKGAIGTSAVALSPETPGHASVLCRQRRCSRAIALAETGENPRLSRHTHKMQLRSRDVSDSPGASASQSFDTPLPGRIEVRPATGPSNRPELLRRGLKVPGRRRPGKLVNPWTPRGQLTREARRFGLSAPDRGGAPTVASSTRAGRSQTDVKANSTVPIERTEVPF